MNWLKTLFSGKPHFYIGGQENPYMLRWFLIPRNPYFNVYLHKFLRDDDDRALHDHPWWFVSLILKGGYSEVVPNPDSLMPNVNKLHRFSIAFRRATHQHRVVLWRERTFSSTEGKKLPCWTIVATGRKKRTWGFWCSKGFVPWFDFVDETDNGNVGKGCE